MNITAFGHVARFFEEDDVQNRLREAIRKNNIEYSGLNEEKDEVQIKKSVKSATTVISTFTSSKETVSISSVPSLLPT